MLILHPERRLHRFDGTRSVTYEGHFVLVRGAVHASSGQLIALKPIILSKTQDGRGRAYRIELDGLRKTVRELVAEVVRFSIEQVLNSSLVSNDLRPDASS